MYHQPTAPSGLGGAYLYQWNDDRCNMKHNFICKYDPGAISQSASIIDKQPWCCQPISFTHSGSLLPVFQRMNMVTHLVGRIQVRRKVHIRSQRQVEPLLSP